MQVLLARVAKKSGISIRRRGAAPDAELARFRPQRLYSLAEIHDEQCVSLGLSLPTQSEQRPWLTATVDGPPFARISCIQSRHHAHWSAMPREARRSRADTVGIAAEVG